MRHVALGDLAEFVNGLAFGPSDWTGEGRPIIRIQNLNDPTKPFNRTRRDVPSRYVVNRGDLLVSWSASLGVFQWDQEEDGLVNQHIFRVVPYPNKVVKNYLRHMLADALETMKRHLQGATMKHVRRRDFLSTRIPLPPIEEQRRIAAILDRADALRDKRRSTLEGIDELELAVFADMFGHPMSASTPWERVPLGAISRIVRGASPRPAGDPRYFGGSIPWLKISDITATRGRTVNSIRETVTEAGKQKSVYLEPGTLILTNSATVGVPKVLGLGSCIHDGFLAFLDLDDRVNQTWLYAALKAATEQLVSLAPHGTQKNLNTGIVKSVEFGLPPRELQDDYEQRLLAIEDIADKFEQSESAMNSMLTSLRSRAFSGRL